MAHKRVVCLLSREPEAQAIYSDMKLLAKDMTDRLEFLKLKANQLKKEHDYKQQELWRKLASVLLAKGYLTAEEYKYERDTIGVDVEGDAIWFKKDGQNESGGTEIPKELAEMILKSLLT